MHRIEGSDFLNLLLERQVFSGQTIKLDMDLNFDSDGGFYLYKSRDLLPTEEFVELWAEHMPTKTTTMYSTNMNSFNAVPSKYDYYFGVYWSKPKKRHNIYIQAYHIRAFYKIARDFNITVQLGNVL